LHNAKDEHGKKSSYDAANPLGDIFGDLFNK